MEIQQQPTLGQESNNSSYATSDVMKHKQSNSIPSSKQHIN